MEIIPKSVQGARALVISPSGGEFITLPVTITEKDKNHVSIFMNLDEKGNLNCRQMEYYSGNEANSVRSSFKSMKPEERERSIKYAIERELKNTNLLNLKISDLNDLEETVKFEFSYSSKNYADNPGEGKYLIFKLPFVAMASGFVGKAERIYDLYIPYKGNEVKTYTINIPENYEVYYVPENMQVSNVIFDYKRDINYNQKENKLNFVENKSLGGGMLKRSEYKKFRVTINDVAGIEREWIVLKKKEK